MIKIEKVSWGKVKVNSQVYHQVLLIGDKVLERDKDKLENLFGTTHEIGGWEQKELLSGRPSVILIASGWQGVLRVKEDFQNKIKAKGIELKVVLTGKFSKEYQDLINKGLKINALVHTTC